jgi:hypothetical protein
VAEDTIAGAETRRGSTGTGQEVFLALLWLGTTLYVAHATLGTAPPTGGALGAAVEAMPDLILASLLTGASLGAAAGSKFRGPGGRLFAGLAIGAAFGVIALFGMRMVYGATPPITLLAATVGVTTLVGGAFAVLPTEIVDGGIWSMTWVAFLGVMFPVWLLGLGDDSFLADTRFQAVLMGLVGLMALQKLRGERRPWFWYPLAGALPGLWLVTAEYLTRFGGSVLSKAIQGAGSGPESLLQRSSEQLRIALIVLAVGGTVCLLASIRTLVRSDDTSDE